MSLILALVLIVIVLCKVGRDKAKSTAFDREKNNRDRVVSEWEGLYVDKDLETRLERYIADERNYVAVREEISKVLSTMEHWRYILDGGFVLSESQVVGVVKHKQAREILRKNQTIALDIMLANRGKVSMLAASFGYKAYVRNGTRDLKESAYEYTETILKLMRLQGAKVRLYYHQYLGEEAYYWEGTHPQHQNVPSKGERMFEFDRRVLLGNNSIPE